MQAKLYPLVLLTSTLLIALTNQPSAAFKLYHTHRDEDFSAESNFQFSNAKGITTLDVVDPDWVGLSPFGLYPSKPDIHEIKRGGTDGLLNDLQPWRESGWTFKKGRDLKGSFNVRRLYACGIGTACGTTRIGGPNGISNIGIGTTLELDYRPSANRKSDDPRPGKNRLQWIQRIITNYAPGQPGVYQSYIDNRDSQSGASAFHPYYGGGTNPRPIQSEPKTGYAYFGDRPYRVTNFNRNYYWIAELYLAEVPDINKPYNVTIYNGVRWGWLYRYFPNNDCLVSSSTGGACPPPPPPPPPPCNGGSGGGGCNRTVATDYIDYQEASILDTSDANDTQYQELSFFDFDDTNWTENEELPPSDKYDDSKSPASVPESTSVLGLLALGAWGIVKALKIKKDK